MIKYAVMPGYITSQKDGNRHYIPADKLIKLYDVNPKECIIVMEAKDLKGRDLQNIKILQPKYNGKYKEES